MSITNEYQTVSEYIHLLNEILSEHAGSVVGEVSELTISAKGHVYFTIKDTETGDQLPCTMWKSAYALNGLTLELGMEVVVRGKPEFYGPFGKLSFIARSVSLVGEGALKLAYDKLKKKLTTEGLFAEERKRALPQFPETIGIITSVHGEVIHDFTSNLRRAGFHLKILDCRVEGPESGRTLTLSVRTMRREKIDVLLLMRGGGSIQSLAGFDNEALAREIVSFPVPVIAGIGHHNDVTLAALAADAAESTPSMVAALLNESWDRAEREVERHESTIQVSFREVLGRVELQLERSFSRTRYVLETILDSYEERVWRIKVAMSTYTQTLEHFRQEQARIAQAITKQLDADVLHIKQQLLSKALDSVEGFKQVLVVCNALLLDHPRATCRSFATSLATYDTQLSTLARIVENNDPERQLRLGYSIATHNGCVVRSVGEVSRGDEMRVKLADGTLILSIMEKINDCNS